MASMDKWAPKGGSVRDPRDTKMKNGPFHNPPRYIRFGGKGVTTPVSMKAGGAVGPISDRGKGRR
jgi:hypothetical protein